MGDPVKPAVAVLAPLPPAVLAALEESFTVHRLWQPGALDGLSAAAADAIRGIATSGGRGCSAAEMDRFPNVEIISCFGVGVDAIDLEAARSRGILVTNTPDVLTEDVADLAIGLLIAAAREIPRADRFVRSGQWLKGGMHLATRLAGKTVGILGLGRIGLAVATRAEAFGMIVAYSSPRKKPGIPYSYYPDAVALADAAHFLKM